ncbi:nwd2 [Moniliophthora roreri MCA 2997]|uniref:Nwd2 n=1 Tax=Moniliophthora roreri (strain MCA 2997) TaxID=1381753 RepID=V2XMU8_MONRO|nr:nwd2 [Moniliophthora roreri MCA 2997]KAI3619207.1 nwd2 [Moniliophthora roreri]
MSMFPNAQDFQILGGQFNVAGRDINNYSADPLQVLWQSIKDVGASHDSGIRYPPPQCHPDTRRGVIRVLHEWIHSPFPEQPVMWLYGPAGAGKSAIAQTMSETGQEGGFLVSSFFFSRGDPHRGIANSLCLCIAYGLATSIPELRELIKESIRKNPAILQATLEKQLEKLIVEPCRTLEQLHDYPWLIVIDGLDECKGSREQQHILSLLATVLPKQIHLRFLICSRPEPHIREVFDVDAFRPYLRRIALDETFHPCCDIATFLDSEFGRIRIDPRNQYIPFPNPWPAPGVIDELAQKACGQFIYATTVIKFIDNEYSNPCIQLAQVLKPSIHRYPEMSSPFRDLDVLYHQILSSNPQHSKLREVLWALVLYHKWGHPYQLGPTPEEIETFLLLPKGDVILTLRGMHSILKVGGPKDAIWILHASFGDFLSHETRSGYFSLVSEQKQFSFLACRTLCALEYYSRASDMDEDDYLRGDDSWVQSHFVRRAWETWGEYCSKSGLNDEVLNALRKFDFTVVFGTHIRKFLLPYVLEGLPEGNGTKIQFFLQTRLLLERLQMDPASYADIIQRFSDYRRGFTVRVSHPVVPDVATSRILDVAARALGYTLVYPTRINEALTQLRRLGKIPGVPDLVKFHFRVISIRDTCRCTRDASRSLLPCSESTSGDVYHIQLSVATREPAVIALSHPEHWHANNETKRLVLFLGLPLHELLDICGPAPELLDPLPRVIWRVRSSTDKEHVLRWLQSFPPEYTDRTSPLIAKVQEIVCRWP